MFSLDMKMAWRNVWRNPRRTWLTVCAIGFACVVLIFMLSFQFGSYETMINSSIKINTGHLELFPFQQVGCRVPLLHGKVGDC